MSLGYLLDTNILSDLARRPRGRVASRVDLLLSALAILPLEPPADRRYGELRHQLAQRGTPIGPNDLLIAAHALAAGLTLVTDSTRPNPDLRPGRSDPGS